MHGAVNYHQALGNWLITHLSNLFTGLSLTDMETGYKAFRAEVLRDVPLRSDGFGFRARDHRQAGAPRILDLRSADPLFRAHPRGGQEDRLRRRPGRRLHDPQVRRARRQPPGVVAPCGNAKRPCLGGDWSCARGQASPRTY